MSKVIFKLLDIILLEESKMNYLISQNARSVFHKKFISHKSLQSLRSLISRGDPQPFTLLVERCQCSLNQRSPKGILKVFYSNDFLKREMSPALQLVRNLELKRLNSCSCHEVYPNKQREGYIYNPSILNS